MSNLTLPLKRFRLAPLLLCFGISLALNLRPALGQAQTVTLQVDPIVDPHFVHYSDLPMDVTVTATLSAERTADTTITLSLSGTATRDTDYTIADLLPTITIPAEATSSTATLSIGPPDEMTEEDTKTIIVRGRASGVSVTSSATITLVENDEAQNRAVLQALYRATNGAGWTRRTNWNSSSAPLDTWHGVTAENGHVTDLYLDNNNLSGRIPPELVHLTRPMDSPNLQVLNLSHNNLSGSIPAELGTLTALEILDLSHNNLSGSIPAELRALTSLTGLHLNNNRLTEPISPDPNVQPGLHLLRLGTLTALEILDLSHNNLSGSIPAELRALTSLTGLHLNNNRLSGPIPDLSDLDRLTGLHLNNNNLSGPIPALNDLARLNVLTLDADTGLCVPVPVPPALEVWTRQRRLILPLCGDRGTDGDRAVLIALFRATNGAGWTRRTNWNSSSAPLNTWHGVTTNNAGQVTALHLNNNNLSGPIPAELNDLDLLTDLNLSHNNLSGPIPDLSDLDFLTNLNLSHNNLSGPIPDLSDLGLLTNLNLSHNNLSGPIPDLSDLLTNLNLSHNNLSGPIPDLSDLDLLTNLNLSHNNLSGPIPAEVGSLDNLTHLNLGSNQLSGSIPTSLNARQSLHCFPPPEEPSQNDNNLRYLQVLDLSNNQLSGPIHPNLGSLCNLTHLNLSSNQLSGSIPTSLNARYRVDDDPDTPEDERKLNKLSNLQVLNLSGNQLSGPIPSNLASLLNLGTLTLDADTGLCQTATLAEWLQQLGVTLPPCGTGGTAGDRAVLLALYRATNGAGWATNTNWNTPTPLNTWHGVTTNEAGRVTALHLDNNNLSGLVPSELGDLTALRILDLSTNNLSGFIPAELGDLPDLQVLRLDGNQLRGALPDSLLNLNLDALTLDADTGLCGRLAQAERLGQLGISLPLCEAVGIASDRAVLQALYRTTNGAGWTMNTNWNTLAPLNTWHGVTTNEAGRVTALHLDDNNLSGLIPFELGDLTSLQVLDLSTNNLSGFIPAELGDLPDLQVLRLDGNQLRGALPDSLLNLDALTLDTDTGLCRTAALAEWLRRLGITLPPCGAGGTTPGTATPLPITPGAPTISVPSQIVSADDVNYFQLYIPDPGILIVETTGDTDTFGRLTQEGTQVVTTDEDSGEDNNFRIAQPVIPGTYSIAVDGGGETGEYTLAVEYRPGVLENPQPGSFQSGIGVISGWVCEADQVVIEFERPGGTVWREPASYGTSRTDTVEKGMCAYPDSGFGLLWNWNKLGPGKHTVRAMVDGIVLAEHTLIVTTLGLGEFPKGLRGDYQLEDFPNSGDTTRLLWQEAQQNFVIAAETGGGGGSHQNPGQAHLENPQPGSFQSGISVISGWVCEADQVVIEFERPGGTVWPEPAGYGTSRTDTSGKCGDSANGFGLLWNWNKLGPGQHTIRALADGFEFARSTFTVTTLGKEFPKGLDAEYELEDFPEVGTTVTVKWQEALQNFTITGVE